MTYIHGSDVWNGVELAIPFNENTDLPFERDIEKIYRAYRTCYSKEPWKDPEISVADQNQLLVDYRKHLHDYYKRFDRPEDWIEQKSNKRILDFLDKFGMDRVSRWLYQAQFIKKHMRHESALEHASFTFTFTDVSRVFSHQLVRHRLASYSQMSQRYCNEENPEFVVPYSIQDNEEARKIFAQYVNQLPNIISALKALGIPKEDIRYLFHNAMKTRIVMTANWREWIHIWNERRCFHAQTEIRECADSAYEIVLDYIPFIFDDISPKCMLLKYCPEERPCEHRPYKTGPSTK